MKDVRRTVDQPHDRLTRLCDAMIAALEADAEHRDGDKAVIMLDDGDRGGIVIHGYGEDHRRAAAAVLTHLKAIFEAHGQTFMIMPLRRDR